MLNKSNRISIRMVSAVLFLAFSLWIFLASKSSFYRINMSLHHDVVKHIKIERSDFHPMTDDIIFGEFTFKEKISPEEFDKKFNIHCEHSLEEGRFLDRNFYRGSLRYITYTEYETPDWFIFEKYQIKKVYFDASRVSLNTGGGTKAYYLIDFELQGGYIITFYQPR